MAERDKTSRVQAAGKLTVNGKTFKSDPIDVNNSEAGEENTNLSDDLKEFKLAVTGERDNNSNDNDVDEVEMPTPVIINRNLWIKLYHDFLIIAAQQPSKPVVWLYNTN
jgi:hypothetical protein